MHDFRSTFLQLIDDFHAGEQPFFLPLQTLDFSNAFLEYGDLRPKFVVTLILPGDHLRVRKYRKHNHGDADHNGAACGDSEIALTLLAFRFAPWE